MRRWRPTRLPHAKPTARDYHQSWRSVVAPITSRWRPLLVPALPDDNRAFLELYAERGHTPQFEAAFARAEQDALDAVQLATIEAEVAALRARLAALEAQVAAVQAQVADHGVRLAEMQLLGIQVAELRAWQKHVEEGPHSSSSSSQ